MATKRPTIIVVPEDEVTDARKMTGSASTRYCPNCKEQTDHAFVVSFAAGSVSRAWQCLRCGRMHE